MQDYSAEVRCEGSEGRYRFSLAYAVQDGRVQSFEWRSRVDPAGHACTVSGAKPLWASA